MGRSGLLQSYLLYQAIVTTYCDYKDVIDEMTVSAGARDALSNSPETTGRYSIIFVINGDMVVLSVGRSCYQSTFDHILRLKVR